MGIPLAAGICWNVALTYLCIGHLNFVAVGFAAIIMGLGVDFAIHLYNRYLDLRVGGQEPASAIEDALADTGPGIVTGALSTAGAFYAMMWVNFKGMREFGFITGSGVLLTLLVMTTLFPAMLLARERITGTYRPRRLRNFGINRWVAQVVRRPRLYFWGIVAVTVVLGFFAVQLRPADALDLAKRAKLNPGVRWQLFLQDHLGSSFKSLMVVLHASDPRVVEAAGTRIYQELREFQRRGRIYLVESLFDYLPPREEQDRALAAFAQALPPDRGAAVPEDLARALDETGFDPAAFAGYQAALAAALADPTPLSLEAISVSGDLKRIADRYLRRRAGDYWLAMYIYPRGKSFSQGELDLLQDRTASIRESSPAEVALVGGVILNHTLKRLTQTGFGAITALAVLTVVGLIFIHFRRIGLTLLTFSPLAVTAIWLGGLMYLLREPITVMNLPVMPMLMGIGIDDAIHVIHCHRHAGRGEVPRTFRLVGKAVVLTTLTTMVGFGSLALCNHPGLHSMGLLTVIGVFLALVTSATLLPAVLTILPLPPDETP